MSTDIIIWFFVAVQFILLIVGVFLVAFVGSLLFYWKPKQGVPWVPTGARASDHMMRLADVKRGETVLDLGCGDGRVVLHAAQAFGANVIGYDWNPVLVMMGKLSVWCHGLRGQAQVHRGDILSLSYPPADVIALYLFDHLNARLEPRLRAQYPQGTRVVTRRFVFPNLREVRSSDFEGETYHLYEL